MSIPLLSIVIPTKNRTQYASSTVQGLLRSFPRDTEIVVADSSDSPAWAEQISKEHKDSALSVIHTRPPFSITDNFNRAVSAARGLYVCIIGDDDYVSEEALVATDWARDKGIDVIVPSLGCAVFYWPDFEDLRLGSRFSGKLFVNKFTGSCRFATPRHDIAKCLAWACQRRFDLPRAYLGIVSKECFLRARSLTGCYFGGVSPDIYSALTIAHQAKSVCCIDYPLIIPGSSGGSNSGRSAMGQHVGALWTDPHMKDFQHVVWPPKVPEFFSVQTVWAQAGFQALIDLGATDDLKRFNWPLLYAVCFLSHPHYLSPTLLAMKRAVAEDGSVIHVPARMLCSLSYVATRQLAKKLYRMLVPRRRLREVEVGEAENISAASQLLRRHLSLQNQSIRHYFT